MSAIPVGRPAHIGFEMNIREEAASDRAEIAGLLREAFAGAFGGGGPRSRTRAFTRRGSGKRGMEDVFGDMGGTHYFHDGGMGARPAGSGTTGYAWGGGGKQE